MPDREDSRDVVGDAVDTVTLNQEVEWERCARLASPTERRALDALRSLAHFFAGSHAPGHSPAGTSATFAGSFAGGFMRNAARAILAIATVEVAAALLLLPWRWDAYRREHGELAVYMVTLFLGHGASACLLLLAGRRDPRTSLLGAYFLLKATLPPMHMLPAFWGGMPRANVLQDSLWELPPQSTLFLYLYAYPFAFAPAFLWAFARECPRLHRRTGLDDFARRMVSVSMMLGFALWGGLASLYLTRAVTGSGFVTVIDVLTTTPSECDVFGGGCGRGSAGAHGPSCGEAARRSVQHRVPALDGMGDDVRRCRSVLAGGVGVLAPPLDLMTGFALDRLHRVVTMRGPRSSSRYSQPSAAGLSGDDRALTAPAAAKALNCARNWVNSTPQQTDWDAAAEQLT